ncbi:putative 11-oxo-beta-amyrin 30-oxidase [Dioscorea sansibarensis]
MMVVMMIWAMVLAVLLVWAWTTWDWLWLTPRRIECELRRQGLRGTNYRIFYGDSKDFVRLSNDARSRPLPLHYHDIGPRVLPFYHKVIKDYGKMSFTWFGASPRVSLMDPELVREVLSKKFGFFEKPKSTPFTKYIFQGLVIHEGEKWAKHRRIVNPAFHLEKLKLMVPAFSTSCDELIRRWDKMIPADEGYLELDVWPELQNFTQEVISRTAFGSNYKEGRRIFQLITEKVQLIMPAFHSVYIPGYRFLPTPLNKKVNQIEKEMDRILRGMIEERQKAMRTGESSKNDLLGILLESNKKEGEKVLGKSKNRVIMTTEDVIQECKVFYFAGHETTSILLTWTMILLGMYPNWQAKAREEVLRVFGKNTPDVDGLSRLNIVTMILYEVLRLYSPAPNLLRKSCKRMELGGITYPEGVIFLLPILLIHHDTEFWGEDAEEFKPERFAEGISKASKVAGAFFPFSVGPRVCIGQNFALIEAKVGLSMILQHFCFELSPSYIHAPHNVFTVQPQHGAQLKLQKL